MITPLLCCAYTQRTYPNGHALGDRVPTAFTGPSRPLLHMRLKVKGICRAIWRVLPGCYTYNLAARGCKRLTTKEHQLPQSCCCRRAFTRDHPLSGFPAGQPPYLHGPVPDLPAPTAVPVQEPSFYDGARPNPETERRAPEMGQSRQARLGCKRKSSGSIMAPIAADSQVCCSLWSVLLLVSTFSTTERTGGPPVPKRRFHVQWVHIGMQGGGVCIRKISGSGEVTSGSSPTSLRS